MSIVHQNKSKYKASNQRVVDWQSLRVIPPGEPGLPRGFCESCALYIWVEGGYKIPGVRGIFCSIGCVESRLFGTAHCRWCAAPLGSTAKKFCDGHCHRQSQGVRFGDGARLLKFLSNRHPRLYEELVGKRGHICLDCGISLEGKRSDSKFCSHQCQLEFRRRTMSGKLRKSGDSRLTDSIKSKTYEGPKTGPLLPPVQTPKSVEIEGVSA